MWKLQHGKKLACCDTAENGDFACARITNVTYLISPICQIPFHTLQLRKDNLLKVDIPSYVFPKSRLKATTTALSSEMIWQRRGERVCAAAWRQSKNSKLQMEFFMCLNISHAKCFIKIHTCTLYHLKKSIHSQAQRCALRRLHFYPYFPHIIGSSSFGDIRLGKNIEYSFYS